MAHTKVQVRLVGEDGNAFSIMARVSKALKRSGQPEAAKEYLARAVEGDYDHLLQVTLEYADDESAEEVEVVTPLVPATTKEHRFTVLDKIVVADPCYIDTDDAPEDMGRLGIVFDDCAGEWIAEAVIGDEGGWGERVSILRATRLGDCAFTSAWEHVGEDNGVDSGQMFIGCVSSFPLDYEKLLERYKGPDGQWDNELKFFDFAKGVVSGTGLGDGSYPVYVRRNTRGNPVAIEVRFLEDNDDDEAENEGEEDDEG